VDTYQAPESTPGMEARRMQSIRTMLHGSWEQIRDLSANTKLFIGSVVVILAMVLFLVSLYAGRASMVALPVSLNTESRARAISYLAQSGVEYREDRGAIMVPTSERDRVVSGMSEQAIITPDQIDFDSMVKDESLFLTKGQYRTRTRVATQNVLARMIAQMANIRSATVVISGENDNIGIGRAFIPRTASVTVLTASDGLAQPAVDAIARMVAGATHGVKTEAVAVIDARTGRSLSARGDDAMSLTRNMDIKLAAEKHSKKTLMEALGYIPGVRVSVNAVVDTRETVREVTTFEEPKVGVTGEAFEESVQSQGSSGLEPGMRANTGVRVTTGSRSPGRVNKDTREETSQIPAFGSAKNRILDAGGYALKINASIGIPRSYFHGLYASEFDGEPRDSIVFDELVQSTLVEIREQIQPLVDTTAVDGGQAGDITVRMFTVVPEIRSTSVGEEAGWTSQLADADMVGTVGLGSLVVLCLGMMFMMLRRSSPRSLQDPILDSELEIKNGIDVEIVDEVEDSQVVLEGVEVGDEMVRRSVMLEQIKESVQSSPEEVAHVLRRWVRTEG